METSSQTTIIVRVLKNQDGVGGWESRQWKLISTSINVQSILHVNFQESAFNNDYYYYHAKDNNILSY